MADEVRYDDCGVCALVPTTDCTVRATQQACTVHGLDRPAAPGDPTPCPKCASPDTTQAYCDACANRVPTSVAGRLCAHGDPEHFHRYCCRCSYQWRTDDVINAQVRCADQPRSAPGQVPMVPPITGRAAG